MVGEAGFEPAHFVIPNHEPSQLGHSPMVRTRRIELLSHALQAHANGYQPSSVRKNMVEMRGFKPRFSRCKRDVFSLSLHPQTLSAFDCRVRIPLLDFGVAGDARNPTNRSHSPVLFLLSYGHTWSR